MTTTNHDILKQAMAAGFQATADWNPENWFPCGSGYVAIKPRNSKFAKWLLEHKENYPELFIMNSDGRKAIMMTPKCFGQAMNPQVSWANTATAILMNHGIKASVVSYID